MMFKICYSFRSTGFGQAGNGFNSRTASTGAHLLNLHALAAYKQGQ